MMPTGPLMVEHRLIERMVDLLRASLNKMEETGKVDPVFIQTAVDFFRTYTDRVHHGKEEDILFDALSRKEISQEHSAMMGTLTEEHVEARKLVGQLLLDKDRAESGEERAVADVRRCIRALLDLYPAHIEKEDKLFFRSVMGYFTEDERDAMLAAFAKFDREQVHAIYRRLIEDLEQTGNA